MNAKQIKEIKAYFPNWKARFYYYKNHYAAMLLSDFVGSGMSLRAIKTSPFQSLLQKPNIKTLTHNLPDGQLTPAALAEDWPRCPETYYLTLGEWPSHQRRWRHFNQTSRPGQSLVLQLNFSNRHNRPYRRLIQPSPRHPFETYCHPIAKDNRHHTLAWARIDFDLDGEDALIEEIQNDWIRLALEAARSAAQPNHNQYRRCTADAPSLNTYITQVLAPHIALWDEAVLAAAIWFLRGEIGIHRIFYHTFQSGIQLKNLNHPAYQPPRSLYTRLPRRFCFQETNEIPKFLTQNRSRRLRKVIKQGSLRFFLLSFD